MADKKKPRSSYVKATQAQIDVRVAKCVEMLLDSYTYTEICQYMTAEYGVSKETGGRYIARANVEIKESVAIERDEYVARKLSQLDKVMRRASNCEQFSAVVGAMNLQSKLARLIDK